MHAGKAVLAILNTADADVAREIEVPQVGEILNPTWSPNGKAIAFSATVGGDSDLFIYDLRLRRRTAASAIKRITSDVYADLQPAWSPDGDTIAFVTDRFTTNAALLNAGDYRLALLDVASGRISPLSTFDQGKNINPQWAPDSRNLFFVSDQNGISNVYRVNLQSGAMAQVTNIDSGISGITALSPAISSAIDARTLAVSAYEDSSHHIYVIDSPQQLAGVPIVQAVERLQAASLPPVQRESLVVRILSDPSTVLVPLRPRSRRTRADCRSTRSVSRTFRRGSTGSAEWSAAASRSTSATCWATTICTRKSAPTPMAAAPVTSRKTPAYSSATRTCRNGGTGVSPSSSRLTSPAGMRRRWAP